MMLAYGAKEVLVTSTSRARPPRMAATFGARSDLETILRSADIVVATTGRPGLIRPEQVRPGR
jgi:malate dehydrogenase (oxaloacetate-decarboxylating)